MRERLDGGKKVGARGRDAGADLETTERAIPIPERRRVVRSEPPVRTDLCGVEELTSLHFHFQKRAVESTQYTAQLLQPSLCFFYARAFVGRQCVPENHDASSYDFLDIRHPTHRARSIALSLSGPQRTPSEPHPQDVAYANSASQSVVRRSLQTPACFGPAIDLDLDLDLHTAHPACYISTRDRYLELDSPPYEQLLHIRAQRQQRPGADQAEPRQSTYTPTSPRRLSLTPARLQRPPPVHTSAMSYYPGQGYHNQYPPPQQYPPPNGYGAPPPP